MARIPNLAPDLTVRQAANAWPACAAALARYSDSQFGGRWSLQELGAFAHQHGRGSQEFLSELADAAGTPITATAKPAGDPTPVPLIFIAICLCLTLGAGWGVLLLLRIAWGVDYGAVSAASVHVHGVAQLWGWMALFVFAVATHLLRQNTRRPAPAWLERTAGGLIVAGLLALFAGLHPAVRQTIPAIDVLASGALASAAALFGVSVIWSLTGRARSQHIHGFLFLIAWLWAWAAADLWLRLRYGSGVVLPDSARRVLIVLPVLGFATNAIYGFGIRLIPGLLNIGHLRPRLFGAAMVMHNAGLCLFLMPWRAADITGAALMLAGSLAYMTGMNFLRSRPARAIYGVDVRGHVLIRAAFFWLVVGLAMVLVEQIVPGLPHAFSGAWRHALTVGFITTMILGVGQRVVPILIKQPLAWPRLMLISAALIIVGNAGRVLLELATIDGGSWTFRIMGFTGVLELAAIVLFTLNLAVTVRRRHHIYGNGEPLTPDTRVREAVNARPVIQQQLREVGISMFDDTPFIAPSLTFGALALAEGQSPQALLNSLRAPAGTCD